MMAHKSSKFVNFNLFHETWTKFIRNKHFGICSFLRIIYYVEVSSFSKNWFTFLVAEKLRGLQDYEVSKKIKKTWFSTHCVIYLLFILIYKLIIKYRRLNLEALHGCHHQKEDPVFHENILTSSMAIWGKEGKFIRYHGIVVILFMENNNFTNFSIFIA